MKLVDDAQLDSDLGDIADAIRAKTGGSSQIAFPLGFVSGIGSLADPSGTTAVAADVAQGKYFLDALGVLTQGTASGGGGTLETETGTWIPSADTIRGEVAFARTHLTVPVFVALVDADVNVSFSSSTNHAWQYFDAYRAFGQGFPTTTNGGSIRYAISAFSSRGNTPTTSAYMISYSSADSGDSSESYSRYWVTESKFYPNTRQSSRYWRAGRHYKWIAVWI